MQSLWSNVEANSFSGDPLLLRVYTSRLLGKNTSLVLHGGGNTSVKVSETNIFGDKEEILYIKGSGWDLATIEKAGFAPVRLEVLQKLAALEQLSDAEMVRMQKTAMTDPNAPTPSVEAILHAILPFRYVDHTHADAVVTGTNTPQGLHHMEQIYGDRVLVIPYVMPGFALAKMVYEKIRNLDWSGLEGMILMNHGIFSFANDAQTSYERMIQLVTEAENFIAKKNISLSTYNHTVRLETKHYLTIANLRKEISQLTGKPMIVQYHGTERALAFSALKDVDQLASRGPLTPDHVIRTKRTALIIDNDDVHQSLSGYVQQYRQYFNDHTDGQLTCLDPAPRWAVWPKRGLLSFGESIQSASIVADIIKHTIDAIETAQQIEKWQALPAQDIFDVEYWELEQAKLKKTGQVSEFKGKVVLITGAASGIGKACAELFSELGAGVIALDMAPNIDQVFANQATIRPLKCDITQEQQIINALHSGIAYFGGLDILINNAGFFPNSQTIAEMDSVIWERSMAVNLTGHQSVIKHCIPFLELGIHPAIIMIASKNVPAPGPGAAAYSAAKAGFTQLARIAALELAGKGIRVNTLHPDAVFDTGIWTDEVINKRARHYGLSAEEYKTKNLLKTKIESKDVARLAAVLAGSVFSKTTGAQIPIDGGNDRVI